MSGRTKVRAETSYTYKDKLSGKEKRFSPKADEVVATFEPQATEATVIDVMSKTKMAVSQAINLQRGFAVFQTKAHEGDTDAAVATLTKQERIANAVPVLIDEEGLTRYFLPDELTVQFKDRVSKEDAERIIAGLGSQVVVEQRTPGYYTVAVPDGKGLFETIQAFAARDEVAFAEPSEAGFFDALAYVPDDPDFKKLWGLNNTGQTVEGVTGTADADIDATEAWSITRGSQDVVVAVIDTGMDLDHPDLKPNLYPQGGEDWDFADVGDKSPADIDGHGTHVAGTVAAVDNVTNVIGVAPLCRLMPLRVDLTSGMNQNRADAINYVAAQAAAHPELKFVVNCSWKMSGDHAGVRNAIVNAVNKNVVVVFAAGNAGNDIDVTPQYPAVYPEVIAVAATDQKDVKASFSNYGTKVDVSAPGVNIRSTYPDNTTNVLAGTSMASPHVAGVAALVRSRNRTLTAAQVRAIVQGNCDNIDAKNPGFAGKLGKGRVNAYKALSATPPAPIVFQLLKKFPFPQANAGSSSGMSFVPLFQFAPFNFKPALLFLTQQSGSEKIFFLDAVTGSVLKSIDPQANDTIGSLEWVKGAIRVANVTTGAGAINTINPSNGSQTGSIPAPVGRGEGLCFDGTYLYYSTITRIHVINPATGAVVRSFPPPGGDCRSLTFGRGYLFSGNSTTGKITVFDPLTLAVRGTIDVPGGGTAQAEGLAFHEAKRELYIANQSEGIIYSGQVNL